MSVIDVTLKITGRSPLVTHNERLANPLDADTQRLSEMTSMKKKTTGQIEAIARLEWEIGQYRTSKDGPVLPMANLRKSLVQGGAFDRTSKNVSGALLYELESVPLAYEGPRDLKTMWSAKRFTDQRMAVVNGKSRVLRCRAIFFPWSVTAVFSLDTDILNLKKFLAVAVTAGKRVGLCEMRPGKGGFYGRYRVEHVS